MKAKHVMTEKVVSIGQQESIWNAENIMKRNQFRHLPVTSGGRVVGLVTEKDIKSYEVPRDHLVENPLAALERYEQPVSEIMERELIKVTPDTELSEVVDMLLTEKVPSLMVLDDLTEELVGIISYVDILSVFQEKENHLKLAA